MLALLCLLRFFFAVIFGAGLGSHFFRCLKLCAAERAEEERMIDEPRLVFLEIDEPRRSCR